MNQRTIVRPATRAAVRGVIASASVLALVGGAGVAAAQVPGGGTGGAVVKTDGTDLVVTVNDKGEVPTRVSGAIENVSTASYRCATPGLNMEGENPGQVTTAEVVEMAVQYYATNVFTGPEGFEVPESDAPLGFGSILDLVPSGSAVGSSQVDVRTAQQSARGSGRTGEPRVGNAAAFTVDAGQSLGWEAVLSPPANGDRGQWQAAALFYCINQSTQKHFVFHGYEDPTGLDLPESETGGSSAGSLDAGSLGS